ncbi:MAG TPA: MCE family protein [Gammaproteobacteria bacterium]|nr:MCE family protein [Gammaproteobacteria bacterium]
MKRETINYFAVGMFVLLALAVLFFVMFRLLSGMGERDVYYTYYSNVAGLGKGTLVTYEGYAFGQVAGIEPQRNADGLRYKVELRVSKDWQIPVDSVARIYSEGLLADTVVNIDEGRAGTFLSPGDALKSEQGIDLFATLGAVAGDFGDLSENALRPLLETLNRTVQQLGDELGSGLPAIMQGMQRLVDKLDRSADHLSGILNAETELQIRRTLDNMDGASGDVRRLSAGLVEVKDEAQGLIRKLDSLVSTSQPDLQQSVIELRHILEQVSRYSDGILQNLDSTSRNMSEFSRQIREHPGRLIGGSAPSDTGLKQ